MVGGGVWFGNALPNFSKMNPTLGWIIASIQKFMIVFKSFKFRIGIIGGLYPWNYHNQYVYSMCVPKIYLFLSGFGMTSMCALSTKNISYLITIVGGGGTD